MAWLLDTSILISIRDGQEGLITKIAALGGPLYVSMISVVELEGGLARDPANAAVRRARLDEMYAGMILLDFTLAEAGAYGRIAVSAGYSRRKLLDRMIAAQALCAEAVLVTLNPQNFDDVPGLAIRAV
jgi:tRNA(fMet)-specific endonuclease VapC